MAIRKKVSIFRTTQREKRLQKRIRELTTLYEVSKLLTSTLDLNEVLNLIVKTTANHVGVKACSVRLLNEKTGEMVLKAAYGLSDEYIQKGQVFAWRGVYKDVISKGQVAIVYDAPTDPRFEYAEHAIKEGIKSMLIVGLIIQGKPIGALSVYTDRHYIFSKEQIQIFKGIANEAASVIEKAILYEERIERQRIEQELAAAAKIQENLMPRTVPNLAGFQISAKNIPSQLVGGDFYDFIPFGQSHLGMVIADVSGKGIPGAILMASARASLRAYLEDPHTVKDVITKLNRVLCRDTQASQFVTLFYGMLDAQELTFTYTNAGHNPPILFRDKEQITLSEGGLVLGVLPNTNYEEKTIKLIKGDLLVFYTDGVTEASKDDNYYGTERLINIVQKYTYMDADEIMKKIINDVFEYNNSSQNDDTTVIVVKYVG
ncbi:TPA: GAF domain-containing protein [Candidatus Poribacteria bacterium]|nr:GAF domain-containing protein [Candidatus Poribacteria bacterium]